MSVGSPAVSWIRATAIRIAGSSRRLGSALLCGVALALSGGLCAANNTIDLTSGTSGALTPVPQSFNETRGVDVTVLSAQDLNVTSMTLGGLFIGSATSATVGARIYVSGSGALLASSNTTIFASGIVNVPITATLTAGASYRVCFYVLTAPTSQGSGTMFDPNPPSIGGFPYVESSGVLQVNSAHAISTDTYPTNPNIFVPEIKLAATLSPATSIDLTSGTSGTLQTGQSFNETRGLDVAVLSATDLYVSSMRLDGLSIGGATSALVGARIYVSGSGSLVASANTTVFASGSVTVPITATLAAGGIYRVCFYVQTTPLSQGSATLFLPSFPYFESAGLLRIDGAQALPADAYPTNLNFGVPLIHMLVARALGTTFCFGDGSGTACPCGNASAVAAKSGCLSSLGVGGKLVAEGVASVARDSATLVGSGMPNSSVLYFQGTSPQSGGAGSAFGDGLRCAAGSIVRLGTKTNVNGVSQYPAGADPKISIKGSCSAGDVRSYQAWYRNSASFCTSASFNLTNGVQFTWGL